jgi:predicted RNA-binding protein with PUA-like domain
MYKRKLKREITLQELKEQKKLENFRLNQRGNRLSVIPVTESEWNFILGLE